MNTTPNYPGICICLANVHTHMWQLSGMLGGVGVINESYQPRLFLGCHAPPVSGMHSLSLSIVSSLLFLCHFFPLVFLHPSHFRSLILWLVAETQPPFSFHFIAISPCRWFFRHHFNPSHSTARPVTPWRPAHYLAPKSLACLVYLLMSVK